MMKPEYLHMYFSFENAMRFLNNYRLKLSSPVNFNDPFEFLPQLKNTDQLVLNTHQEVKTVQLNTLIEPLVYWTANQLLEYGSEVIAKKAHNRIEQFLNRYRIACFSEDNNNILMWSHYGDRHRGVVISFKNAFEYFENNIEKVEYSDDRIKIPFWDKIFQEDEQVIIKDWERKLLITKSNCWSYEKEWRLLKTKDKCINDNGLSFYQLDKDCISNITLGCCISAENRKKMKEFINNNSLGHIYLQQSIPSDKSFQLTSMFI